MAAPTTTANPMNLFRQTTPSSVPVPWLKSARWYCYLSSFPYIVRRVYILIGIRQKQVLCVRTDLGMTKGKIAAQCGHATLACYKAVSKHAPLLLKRWEYLGQAKIALKVDSEEELLTLQAQAMSLGLVAKVVRDAGRTQIAANSATVLGVGPGE